MVDIVFYECVGIIGSILVAISMVFKTTTDKGIKWLRIFNLLGSVVFVVYGMMLPAYSTVILNLFCIVFNLKGLIEIIKKINNPK